MLTLLADAASLMLPNGHYSPASGASVYPGSTDRSAY